MASYQYPLMGKKELFIGGTHIPARLLADEAMTITVTPQTTEIASQAGTYNIPNGSFEELSATFTVNIPSVHWLGQIFPGLYKAAAFKRASLLESNGETGQVAFGADACSTIESTKIVLHPVCMGNDSSQDVTLPNAFVSPGGEFTFSTDPFTLEVSVSMMPDEEGAVIFGEGNLQRPAHYDPEVQDFVPDDVPATAITANPDSVTGAVNATVDVAFTLTPANSTDTLTVTSADEATATVAPKDGAYNTFTVTLKKAGNTTLHAVAGKITKDISVKVNANS